MHFDLRHLRTLQALEETGTLSAAARRLHLTQSALSHQLRVLEDQIGGPVFVRKSRPLRFTPQGARLLQLAQAVLPHVERARRDLERMALGQNGRLFIAIECHSCFAWLMPAMDRYRDLWPEVEMDLTTAFAFDPLPALKNGELDLVITSDPRSIPGLDYAPLFSYQALLALAHEHPLTRRPWIAPTDLAHQTLITYPVERSRLDLFTRFLDPAGVTPAAVRQTELTAMMMQLVASRRGVAALPDWALWEYLERDYVTARPLGRSGLTGTLHAAFRKEDEALPYLQDFLETARRLALRKGREASSAEG